MNPLPNAEKFLKTTLGANAGVIALVGNRIYSRKSPEKPISPNTVVYPCVVFAQNSGMGSTSFGNDDNRTLEVPIYIVKAITKGDDLTVAHKIANAIHETLRTARGLVEWDGRSVNVQGVRLQEWIEYEEEDEEGTTTNHVGATFRLFISGV